MMLTKILINIPIVPMPSGDIPHNQFDEELSSGCMNLKYKIYPRVKIRPAIIPEMAPSLFMTLVKIPKRMAGKRVAAASPNAKATTCATKPGGYIPNKPAIMTAMKTEKRAYISSFFSEILVAKVFFMRS